MSRSRETAWGPRPADGGLAYGIVAASRRVRGGIRLFPLYWLFVISTKSPQGRLRDAAPASLHARLQQVRRGLELGGFSDAFINSVQVVVRRCRLSP